MMSHSKLDKIQDNTDKQMKIKLNFFYEKEGLFFKYTKLNYNDITASI